MSDTLAATATHAIDVRHSRFIALREDKSAQTVKRE